jgi:hypothetical protein
MTDSASEPGVTGAPEVPVTTEPVLSDSSDNQVVNQAGDSTTQAPADASDVTPTTHPSGRAAERIQDLVAERNAAKEYAEYWRSQALAVMRTPTQPAVQQSAPPTLPAYVTSPSPPTLDQFKYDQNAWAKAHGEWSQYQIKVGTQQAVKQEQQQKAQSDVIQSYNEKIEQFKKDHPDFDILTQNPALPSLDKIAAAMVINSDKAAELTYHLAQNPDEATRIARLPPTKQALAIGRLEGKFVQQQEAPVTKNLETSVQTAPAQTQPKKAPPAPVVTQAPDPLTPIQGGAQVDIDPSSVASVNDWMRMRNAEARSRRRGGRVA